MKYINVDIFYVLDLSEINKYQEQVVKIYSDIIV